MVEEEDEATDHISVTFTQDLIQDIAALYNRPKLHDVLFQTPSGDDIAVAHKTILGARSSYWHKYFSSKRTVSSSSTRSLLTSLSTDQNVELVVIEESPAAFLSVLKYLYTNRFARVPSDILANVVLLAKKYELCELVAKVQGKKDAKLKSPFLDPLRISYGIVNGEQKTSAYPTVLFQVEKYLFQASPLLLIARSNYFSIMFGYKWSESLSISYGLEENDQFF